MNGEEDASHESWPAGGRWGRPRRARRAEHCAARRRRGRGTRNLGGTARRMDRDGRRSRRISPPDVRAAAPSAPPRDARQESPSGSVQGSHQGSGRESPPGSDPSLRAESPPDSGQESRPGSGASLPAESTPGSGQELPPAAVESPPASRPGAGDAWYVHGLAGSSANWTALAGALSRYATGYLVDLPGHGRSDPPPRGHYSLLQDADVLARLIARYSSGPVHLVANSMGGVIATALAARHPELVATLTLISPAVPDLRLTRDRGADPVLALLLMPGTTRPALRRLGAIGSAARARGIGGVVLRRPVVAHGRRLRGCHRRSHRSRGPALGASLHHRSPAGADADVFPPGRVVLDRCREGAGRDTGDLGRAGRSRGRPPRTAHRGGLQEVVAVDHLRGGSHRADGVPCADGARGRPTVGNPGAPPGRPTGPVATSDS